MAGIHLESLSLGAFGRLLAPPLGLGLGRHRAPLLVLGGLDLLDERLRRAEVRLRDRRVELGLRALDLRPCVRNGMP